MILHDFQYNYQGCSTIPEVSGVGIPDPIRLLSDVASGCNTTEPTLLHTRTRVTSPDTMPASLLAAKPGTLFSTPSRPHATVLITLRPPSEREAWGRRRGSLL